MSFAQTVVTNIKSPDGEDYRVDLGQKTILIGENEAGKSAIAEAVQLARTGEAFGLLYRSSPIKDGKLLSSLIPPGQKKCQARVVLDSGEACLWAMEEGKRPIQTGPFGSALTIAQLHKVMAGSTETKLKFFLGFLHYKISVQDLMGLLPKDLHETLILVCPLDKPIFLGDLLEKIGSIQRNQSAEVRASQIALESMGAVRHVSDDEVSGAWNTFQRAMYRDLLKMLYIDYRADPALQAGHVLSHLTKMLGGKEAIQRIPPTEDLTAQIGENMLHKRMTRVAVRAKDGEYRASKLRASLKELKTAILQVMHDLLDDAAEKFCKAVGSFLPEEESFLFEPNGKDLTIGILRNGERHIALSGSTEARVLAAIASAMSGSMDVIVVDDRMWDPRTLAKTLKVLEKAPCQVIVMSTAMPRGKKRKAWTYVEVSRTPGEPLDLK